MKNHVLRPLFVALAVVATILFARMLIVPADFGIYERGYMYGWHRKSNEAEWQKVTVKYKTSKRCAECHKDKYEDIKNSAHAPIGCENCHGPAYDHPKEPLGLTIDRKRELCIRCHALLPYKTSPRGNIPGIDPLKHYPQAECIMCHYPHNPVKPNPKYSRPEVKP